ncbi:MAG: MlaD family protein [Planctomycetota bacterium]|jgi:hypothetical protein
MQPSSSEETVPLAVPISKKQTRLSWFWLVTVLCGVLSLVLFARAYQNQGDLIHIEFEQGHGLQPGESLRYRGIEVGRVEKIALAVPTTESSSPRDTTPGILVSVRLNPSARRVVTDGTIFWIARPIVSFDSIRGLDTIVGPKYIAMEPGPSDKYSVKRFAGLESAPPIRPKEGSVEIILDSPKRYGLDSGTPILHRGFHVGDVLSVTLASDARSVLVRCAIDPEFHELVRTNTKFWLRSGWRVSLGITGLELEADSLSQVLYGGIEFATPDSKGKVVGTGARFVLHEKPDDDWDQWKPSLPYGAIWDKLQRQSPVSYRTSLVWKQNSFGFQVDKQKLGWGLLLDDGSMLCREDFATLSKSAIDKSGQLEVAGVSQETFDPMETIPLSDGSKVVRIKLTAQPSIAEPLLDSSQFLRPVDFGAADSLARDILIVGSETERSVLVDGSRYSKTDRGLQLDSTCELPGEFDGTPVVDVQQGRWLGVMRKGPKGWLVALPTR